MEIFTVNKIREICLEGISRICQERPGGEIRLERWDVGDNEERRCTGMVY